MSPPSFSKISTTPTDDDKPRERQERDEMWQTFELQRPTRDDHSHECDVGRPDRYPPPTIIVYNRSPRHQEELADDNNDKDDSGCKRAAAAEQESDMLVNQRRIDPVRQQLQRNADMTRRKIHFSEEKLCLLEKMMAGGNFDFPCTLRVVTAENAVELVAVADENVTQWEMLLHEQIANFNSISLNLSRGVAKLLQSNRGQSWLQTQLASMNAVFYAKDSAYPFVLGADDKTSTDAKFLLENKLSSKKIPFDDQYLNFLRSSQWADAVDKFESDFFVTVSTAYRENEIVVEGSINDLNNTSKRLEMMLKQNGRVQRKIDMSADQFQLLLHFRVEIDDDLKSVMSQHQQNRYLQSLLIQDYSVQRTVCLTFCFNILF